MNLLEDLQRVDWKPQGLSKEKPIRPVPARGLTLSQASEEMQLLKTALDLESFCIFAPLASSITKDREHNHDHHGHENDHDTDLHQRQKEANESDQLLQQRDHEKDESDDCTDSTENSKNATTHKFDPVR